MQQDYIFSMYQVKNQEKIGLLEYSADNQKRVEVDNIDELIFMSMKGQNSNYMGLKFNKYAEDIQYFTINIESETKTFDVNTENDGTFTDSYLIQVDFDPEKVNEISIFNKNDEKLHTISR